jgi:hypothetical protein
MVIVEKLVEWRLARETEVLGENLPQRHVVHHNLAWLDPVSNPGRRGGKPATNRLSYGAPHAAITRDNIWTLISYRTGNQIASPLQRSTG